MSRESGLSKGSLRLGCSKANGCFPTGGGYVRSAFCLTGEKDVIVNLKGGVKTELVARIQCLDGCDEAEPFDVTVPVVELG